MANGRKLNAMPLVMWGRGGSPAGSAVAVGAEELTARLLLRAEIRKRAYEIFCEHHRTPGKDLEDWLRAEAEVRARHGVTINRRPRVFANSRNVRYAGIEA